jgi:hypothetical protein
LKPCAVAARLRHDLDALALVLLDGELAGVEEDRVPALRQARADHVPLGAVVEVQRDGDPHVLRVGEPHRVHRVQAGHLHVLDRRLEDDRGPQLLGGGEDGLHREIVDDVDGRDAVPAGERAVENLLGRHDWHASTLRRSARNLGVTGAPDNVAIGIRLACESRADGASEPSTSRQGIAAARRGESSRSSVRRNEEGPRRAGAG